MVVTVFEKTKAKCCDKFNYMSDMLFVHVFISNPNRPNKRHFHISIKVMGAACLSFL